MASYGSIEADEGRSQRRPASKEPISAATSRTRSISLRTVSRPRVCDIAGPPEIVGYLSRIHGSYLNQTTTLPGRAVGAMGFSHRSPLPGQKTQRGPGFVRAYRRGPLVAPRPRLSQSRLPKTWGSEGLLMTFRLHQAWRFGEGESGNGRGNGGRAGGLAKLPVHPAHAFFRKVATRAGVMAIISRLR